MPVVRVEPMGIELDVKSGESIFAAALRQGYGWPTVCGGRMTCLACMSEIRAGADALAPMSEAERKEIVRAQGAVAHAGFPLRLACQCYVNAEGVIIFKRGVVGGAMVG